MIDSDLQSLHQMLFGWNFNLVSVLTKSYLIVHYFDRQQKKLMKVLSKIDSSVEESEEKSNRPPSSKPVKATHPLNDMVNKSSKVIFLIQKALSGLLQFFQRIVHVYNVKSTCIQWYQFALRAWKRKTASSLFR